MIKWFKKQPIGTKIMLGIGLFFILCALICCSNLIYDDGKSSTIEVVKTTDTPGIKSGETKQLEETPDTNETQKQEDLTAPFEIMTNIDGLKIKVTKITNDTLLKIYLKYENETGLPIDLSESCSKIVADGVQYEWDFDINYNLNQNSIDNLESGTTYESILAFKKIEDSKFNLVLNCNYDEYRINSIIIK